MHKSMDPNLIPKPITHWMSILFTQSNHPKQPSPLAPQMVYSPQKGGVEKVSSEVMGNGGDVDCPPSAVPLADADACEAAAKALSKAGWNNMLGSR